MSMRVRPSATPSLPEIMRGLRHQPEHRGCDRRRRHHFESTATYVLTVEVSDGTLNDQANLTIDVADVNEAQTANAQATVAENSANGTIVTTLAGTDVDAGATPATPSPPVMLPVTLQSTPTPSRHRRRPHRL